MICAASGSHKHRKLPERTETRRTDPNAAQRHNCAYNAKQPPDQGGYFLHVRQFAQMRAGNADKGKSGEIASGAIVRQFQTILLCIRENLQFSRKFHKLRNCQNQAKSGIMEPSRTGLKALVKRPYVAAVEVYINTV